MLIFSPLRHSFVLIHLHEVIFLIEALVIAIVACCTLSCCIYFRITLYRLQ